MAMYQLNLNINVPVTLVRRVWIAICLPSKENAIQADVNEPDRPYLRTPAMAGLTYFVGFD